MWYQDWFADERYLALYKHRNNADAAALLDLIERTVMPKKSACILDLACGAGRHSIALAKRGYTNITGLDLSPTLIRKARESAASDSINIRFIEGDMRSFEGEYDLILNLFTSFGYFDLDADNEAVIVRIGQALYPNGYFVIDFFNADFVRRTLNPHSSKTLPSGELVDESRELTDKRVNKKIIITAAGGSTEHHELVRLYTHDELVQMIERAPMKVSSVFGSYTGEQFDKERSERCIIFATKK